MSSFAQPGSDGVSIPISDRVLGTAFLVVTFLALAGTRSTAVLIPVLAAIVFAFALKERDPLDALARPAPATIALAVLMGYALLSATWSISPWDSLPHVLVAAIFVISGHVMCTWIDQQSPSRIDFLVTWMVIAFITGTTVLLFEVLNQQAVKRWFLQAFVFLRPESPDKHIRFDTTGNVWLNPSDLNRNIASLNLLLWPVLMATVLLWHGHKRRFLVALLVAAVASATFGSEHETSKLALAVALVVFAATRFFPRVSAGMLAAVWIVAVLGVVPIAWQAYHSFNLQNAKWIQFSGQERIAIWGDLAQRTLEAPYLGIGARMTNKLNALGTASLSEPPLSEKDKKAWPIGRHPHNVYLQTWFELGAVGAMLFAAAGLLALRQLARAGPLAKPFAFATAAVIMVELGLCWDIWQRWFFALLTFAIVVLTFSLRLAAIRSTPGVEPAGVRV